MPSSAKTFAAIAAFIGWFALLLQLYLIIQNRAAVSLPEIITRYFSYFTILTNILVAVSCTAVYVKGISAKGSFLTRPKTLTATAVYITIVGLIYNVILRFLWVPQGWDKVADELLHSIMPALFIIFWITFVPKKDIEWKNIFPWLIYPLVYLGYTLLRGPSAQWYPYPFVNVATLGYHQVLINSAGITAIFIITSLLFIGIAKMMSKRTA